MTYVMQGGQLFDEHGERIGQIDTGGKLIEPGMVVQDANDEKARWKEVFSQLASAGRSDLAKTLLGQSDMTPAEIIKTLQTAPGQGATPKRGAVGPGDMYAAGQADAKQLVGRPEATTSDQAPSEAEKERFEQFADAIRKTKEEEDKDCTVGQSAQCHPAGNRV